ncbi:MAG: retron system putative HNH endonuclease [Candidatus Cryptobacteroides sp.]
MKHIKKNAEPTQFADWKTANPNARYKDDLCNFKDGAALTARTALKRSLLSEQKYICCYCECRVSDSNSHIEHFRPKDASQFPQLQLEYSNLLASCTKTPTGLPDEHCGHKKGNFFSTDLVSPLEIDCSSHFGYMMDGSICGLDVRGSLTIQKMNLDSSLLNTKRKNLIDYFLNIDDVDEFNQEIEYHLDEGRPKLGEFFTMIDYLHSNGQLK